MEFRSSIRLNPFVFDVKGIIGSTPKTIVDEVVDKVDVQFRKHEKSLFASEGASGGTPWDKLSPHYKRYKSKKRRGRKILVWDSSLRKDLSTKTSGHIAKAYKSGFHWILSFGTQNQLANKAKAGDVDRPPRDPMQHTEPQWQAYGKVIRDVLAKRALQAVSKAKSWRG